MSAKYQYNPHRHTKIWLTNNQSLFLNLENQVRLAQMREQNPADEINLIYDSSLLNPEALQDLRCFCNEHRINPVNAHDFQKLVQTENEIKLFAFYKDEIEHLHEGGNLAVASDILRWLSPVYSLGSYTDFDFPVNTSTLPPTIEVMSPLLLNIGSFKMGRKELILSNNDYIAIVDPHAAKNQIERVQAGLINRLTQYDNDFVSKSEKLFPNNFFYRYMLQAMKNRAETFYIHQSKELGKNFDIPNGSSREIRHCIRKVMSDKKLFINFNRKILDVRDLNKETDAMIIKRLKTKLQTELSIIKQIFFNKEYAEIKHILQQDDDTFLQYIINKELNLYLKSIIVCTTGPIEIANALFGDYVFDTKDFKDKVQPLSFHFYHLQRHFKSPNTIPLHENILGMLHFLGQEEGELNDSSWLDSGQKLQELRIENLKNYQQQLATNLPQLLQALQDDIKSYLKKLETSLFFKKRQLKKHFLQEVLTCFIQEKNSIDGFDVEQFKSILIQYSDTWWELPGNKTKKIIIDLERLSHHAIIFGLTQNRKINIKRSLPA